MSSEGRYEIEAAKHRLAAAKTQVSSAETNMACAREMLLDAQKSMDAAKAMMEAAKTRMSRATKNSDTAKLQLENSKEEVTAAQTCLAEAEKRWEVIDIDGQPDSPNPEERSSKRRKVSLSPTERSSTQSASDRTGAAVGTAAAGNINGRRTLERRPQNNDGGAINNSLGLDGRRVSSVATRGHDSRVTKIEVQGCGISGANGTYTRLAARYHSAPVFARRGKWNGGDEEFRIMRLKFGQDLCWCIIVLGSEDSFFLYRARISLRTAQLPSENHDDWFVLDESDGSRVFQGAYPRPRIKLVRS